MTVAMWCLCVELRRSAADLVSSESGKPAAVSVSDWCNNWPHVA